MRCAIIYLTGRREPCVNWLLEGLGQQAEKADKITLVVIDQLKAWEADRGLAALGVGALPACVDCVLHFAPKPNPWSGPARLTSREWWSKSNSANTGIVRAPADVDYLVFMDDRAKIGPNWLKAVRRGFRKRSSVLAGTYERLETKDDQTVMVGDHRRDRYPKGRENCEGGWCYGCVIALPLEWVLTVNGFEEGCDSLTGEDYIFGKMLENAGYRIDFSTELFVTLDRTLHNAGGKGGRTSKGKGYAATDKGVSPNDKSHAALDRFGSRKRTELTPDLRALRAASLAGTLTWPLPDPNMADWYDNQLVREMQPPP